MMLLRCLLAITLTAACMATQAAEADWQNGLGRLFMTPQKRALLDELRHNNARMTPSPELDTVRLDGIVRRSSGKQTIWINGQSYEDHAPVTQVGESTARVITGSKTGVELKVGESRRLAPNLPPSPQSQQ